MLSSFSPEGLKYAMAVAQSPPQELWVSLHSRLYLLVSLLNNLWMEDYMKKPLKRDIWYMSLSKFSPCFGDTMGSFWSFVKQWKSKQKNWGFIWPYIQNGTLLLFNLQIYKKKLIKHFSSQTIDCLGIRHQINVVFDLKICVFFSYTIIFFFLILEVHSGLIWRSKKLI